MHLTSTYRLQFTPDFGFAAARALVPYLAELGVSHLYSSPVLKARPGSTHGYDVVDPTVVNPELGGEGEFLALAEALHARGMGLLLDIVPNHMGTGAENPYWDDVLRYGLGSRYAHWFDIDWDPPDPALRGRVLLPVLGDAVEAVLARGELTVEVTDGAPRLRYFDHSFPIDPATAADPLPDLLARQHYVLAWWRDAARRINYRRFFEVDDLVALRADDPDVFAATHARVLDWVGHGIVDGLRIDHIDGLLDPLGYLERLRAEVTQRRPHEAERLPIVVEKILSPGESLRRDWPVEGTTGYEFIADVEALFVDADGAREIERAYRRVCGLTPGCDTFSAASIEGKRYMLGRAFGADVSRVVRRWPARSAHAEPGGGDVRAAAVAEFIACLPVYRTYIDGRVPEPGADDRARIELAFARAVKSGRVERGALDALRDVLLAGGDGADPLAERRLEFVQRLQQTTGPATAKGVEDTALYRYAPLASLNEVGGDPARDLGDAVARFHAANQERAEAWPRNLLAATTHDTKRSADLRARLDVLSEIPREWADAVERWRGLNAALRTDTPAGPSPDANLEQLYYQSLLGVWPAHGMPDGPTLATLRERLAAYVLKAAREAKQATSWTDPNQAFEDGLARFVEATLICPEGAPFREEMASLARRVAGPGVWNALARHTVQLTAPGVPDMFQGDELWRMSLVDPDNRRPVDWERRARFLRDDARSVDDGALKLYVTRRLLAARGDDPALFVGGGYLPLDVVGAAARHVVAYARTAAGGRAAVVVVPRLAFTLAGPDRAPVGADLWEDTAVVLPVTLGGRAWRCALTGRLVTPSGSAGVERVSVAELFATIPSSLLFPVGA